MTAAASPAATSPRRAGRARRLSRALTRGPLHAFLIVVALVWMIPTVGLLVTSLRAPSSSNRTG